MIKTLKQEQFPVISAFIPLLSVIPTDTKKTLCPSVPPLRNSV